MSDRPEETGSVSIGTAGWTIPRTEAAHFPTEGSSLERYAALFPCAEINSSFHRSHRPATYERWAGSVPPHFRFSAKIPKTITHQQKLKDVGSLIDAFSEEVRPLGTALAVLLVQLPPSLAFDAAVVEAFFRKLSETFPQKIACEPRHASWFSPEVDQTLSGMKISRVAADPARCAGAERPGGSLDLVYYRLHGSPIMYRSSYEPERLRLWAQEIAGHRSSGRDVWCIFDNTASSAATGNALLIQALADGS